PESHHGDARAGDPAGLHLPCRLSSVAAAARHDEHVRRQPFRYGHVMSHLQQSLAEIFNSEQTHPQPVPWIVCAYYTGDYRPWADLLISNLDFMRIPHDIVEVSKLPGGWEANTMAKPAQLLAAMDRHPGRTIIFLDVDCEVFGDLTPLSSMP